ncbi:MmgE/PrpD family protein [Polynucleobacter kasalickyi]|uniref:2-methylcitrate dehydratase PrpD n=1 Tax=Polynucleobacter kasalickyi TaxID=1938817 RepID=A0A1W1YMQ5_9BURK|nr:MmgE/PrpD family protein [Polynucleobacter kasalickyi]SMC37485.1 2-methylcitrate dehydratase PrpD [Polynucleobacter kasalickyi]
MKRRQFLTQSSYIIAGSALPMTHLFAKETISPEMEFLSNYMSQAYSKKLPEDILEQAKFHILDTFSAILSGSELAPGVSGINYVKRHGSTGKCTVIGTQLKAGPLEAALANGMMGHADETDDSHGRSRSHPGCSIVPATMASSEIFGITGDHFIKAVTLGYDVGTRLLMSLGGPEFSYTSHKSSHSIAGMFGSAAAASCVAKFNPQKIRWVFDYTAQQSSGIAAWGRDTDHIEKAFVFAGMPARNGVASALLVDTGWNGIDDIFSGADNYFLAYAPNAKPNILVDKLGVQFEIALTDIKKWSVGSPIQGPLDALSILLQKNKFNADDVEKLDVRLAPSAAKVVNNREMPDICLQHMMAIMLMDKTASFKAAHDIDRMKDAKVLAQRAKVNLISDENLNQFMPIRVAIVEVILKDGRRFSERVDAVRGTPRNPMTKVEVFDKALDLIGPVIGNDQSKELLAFVNSLEQQTNLNKLSYLLQKNS